VQADLCAPDNWVMHADVDEFHRWPEPLGACLARAAALGADCVQGVMIDRLAPGGRLAPVLPDPPVLEQFPLRAEVAWSVGGASPVHGRGGTVKMMAARGRLLPHRGGHRPALGSRVRYLYRYPLGSFWEIDDPAFRFSVPTQVDHVHWTDTLPERLRTRLATPGVSPAGAEYGRRQLDHIAAHGGRIALGQVALEGRDGVPPSPPPRPGAPGQVDWPGWPDRLEALRRMGRIKPLISPARRAVRRVAGRRAVALVNAGRRAVGLRPIEATGLWQ
jgi:hypothetical protein